MSDDGDKPVNPWKSQLRSSPKTPKGNPAQPPKSPLAPSQSGSGATQRPPPSEVGSPTVQPRGPSFGGGGGVASKAASLFGGGASSAEVPERVSVSFPKKGGDSQASPTVNVSFPKKGGGDSVQASPSAAPKSPPISRKPSTLAVINNSNSKNETVRSEASLQRGRSSSPIPMSVPGTPGAGPVDAELGETIRSKSSAQVNNLTTSGGDAASQADTDRSPVEAAAETPVQQEPEAFPKTPEERIAELEATLATRDRELHLSREQVLSLQRLQANSSLDAKVRILNDERAKLASKAREVEAKLHKEITKLKSENKAKDFKIQELKAAATKEQGTKKSIQEVEALKAHAEEMAASNERQTAELNKKVTACQQIIAEKEAELHLMQQRLQRAQEAIVCSTDVGFGNEVKLHQARSALHSIMAEVTNVVSSPHRVSRSPENLIQQQPSPSPSPHQQHQQQQQQLHQQPPSPSGSPHREGSTPRYVFNYSPRNLAKEQRRGTASPSHHHPTPSQATGGLHGSFSISKGLYQHPATSSPKSAGTPALHPR